MVRIAFRIDGVQHYSGNISRENAEAIIQTAAYPPGYTDARIITEDEMADELDAFGRVKNHGVNEGQNGNQTAK